MIGKCTQKQVNRWYVTYLLIAVRLYVCGVQLYFAIEIFTNKTLLHK